jgi:V/A-type H+-transporting ATPase subunit I
MIAPMKKVYLVLLEADKKDGLKALRALGLVHIETAKPSGPSWDEVTRDFNAVSAAINMLPPNKKVVDTKLDPQAAVLLARRVVAMEERKAAVYGEIGSLSREIERCVPWGEFDPSAAKSLEEAGLWLRFYVCEPSAEARIPEDIDYIVLSRAKKSLLVATIGRGAPAPDLPLDFLSFTLPAESPEAMRSHRKELEAEIESLRGEAVRLSDDLPSLKFAQKWLAAKMTYETVSGSFEGEGKLCALKGFVPAASAQRLAEAAKAQNWALLLDEPAPDDVTPTKVENGPFVSIIKPVFDFLGVVPAYTEYEISPWFLGFFTLFTAMIFGDGGYGALLLLAWALLSLKARRAGKGQSDSLKLLFLIAALTMTWGAVTGTWFSIPVDSLPPFMRGIWLLSNANPAASKNIQIFCFLIGALQLSIARIKNIIRDLPNLKFLSQLGSLSLVIGMLFFVLNLVVDSKRFPVPPFALWLVLFGFLANMIFGAYEGNVLKSAVEGLKNIIPTFLGAVGVFADIVSYIRLWALGLAGSALASIINGMGGGMVKPALIGAVGVIILLFGHGLNLILSVLSVVVHAVRLNILEFSCNHLGMQWSGIAYDPFKATIEDTAVKGKESGV